MRCPSCGSRINPLEKVRCAERITFYICPSCDYSSWDRSDWVYVKRYAPGLREKIERARQAQQENEQKHDVQLEIPTPQQELKSGDHLEWEFKNIPMAEREHTQQCLDDQLMHHAATGGDLENCWCPPLDKK